MTNVITTEFGPNRDSPCKNVRRALKIDARNLQCLERMITYCQHEAEAHNITEVADALAMAQLELQSICIDERQRS